MPLPSYTQDSLQMLWLATYLTGFPPAGLYALNWAHGLTLSVCLNSNISASYPDEYNVWKYTTPLDSKKAAIHNCLLYSRISYYFSNGIQFHNSNNFIFPVSFSPKFQLHRLFYCFWNNRNLTFLFHTLTPAFLLLNLYTCLAFIARNFFFLLIM